MKVRLAKRGAPSKDGRMLIAEFNDWLDTASDSDKIRYGKDYSTIEEIRDAYSQATGKTVNVNSADNISDSEYFETVKPESISVSNDIPDAFDFDPNAANVIEREYNKERIDPTMQDVIGEPIFSTDPIPQTNESQPQAGGAEQPQSGFSATAPQQPEDPMGNLSNPQMNEMDDKAKKIASAQMVDLILDLYSNAHQWVKPMAKVKEKKIIELEAKGLIDPTDTLQVDHDGTRITARELVSSTNDSIDNILTPDPTFNGKVREPMIREFAKRGWGLTDMQYILMMFGQDIATKGAMIVGVRKNMSSILDIYKEQKKERVEFERSQVKQVEPDSIKTNVEEPVMETEQVY